jgi:hypothetical protein
MASMPNLSGRTPKWLAWAIVEKEDRYQPTLLGHIALSSSLISIVIIGYCIMFAISSSWEKEWIGTPEGLTSEQLEATTTRLASTPTERTRLIAQFQEIETLATRHAKIMGFFYKQYYISLAMMGTSAAVAVISLFFISKVGWERASNAVINIFIVATGVVIFYGNMSLVFQQRNNLEASQKIYLSYSNLRNEVLSYWATGETIADERATPAKFIHYVDRQLSSISLIQLGFDPNSIPDFSKRLDDLTNPTSPSLSP